MSLPDIQPEKWRRYNFESKDMYYSVILQQNLFHEWSIIKLSSSKKGKTGAMSIELCFSYEDAKNKIEKIKRIRRSRKYVLKKVRTEKLGLNFEKIGLIVGNML
jgi:hypothetical protein